MLKIEISLANPMFAPPDAGIVIAAVLQSLSGTLMHRVQDLGPDGATITVKTAMGTATVGRWTITDDEKTDSLRETDKTAAPETRRDRLARLLTWECVPWNGDKAGTTRLVASLASPASGPPLAQRCAVLWFDGNEEAFFRTIRHVRESILDEVEALADTLA